MSVRVLHILFGKGERVQVEVHVKEERVYVGLKVVMCGEHDPERCWCGEDRVQVCLRGGGVIEFHSIEGDPTAAAADVPGALAGVERGGKDTGLGRQWVLEPGVVVVSGSWNRVSALGTIPIDKLWSVFSDYATTYFSAYGGPLVAQRTSTGVYTLRTNDMVTSPPPLSYPPYKFLVAMPCEIPWNWEAEHLELSFDLHRGAITVNLHREVDYD